MIIVIKMTRKMTPLLYKINPKSPRLEVHHARLYSFRALCMSVSLTAQNTNLMFSVSAVINVLSGTRIVKRVASRR